ncbi:unnamed protein product [Urochloa humidicola]
MSGGVVVTKGSPAVVRPSESEPRTPAAVDTVTLSSFDSCMPPFPVTMLLVFDRAIDAPVETIKTALSRALAHYPLVAGRIAGDGSSIACNGVGVTFVPASANCSLKEAAVPQMDDLAVGYPDLLCRSADPLLMVQVTEFSCGGFTVGVTWNHLLADGAGMVQFLLAVGELARCGISPPSVVPVRRWDDSLPSLPSSTVAAQKSTLLELEPQYVTRLDVIIPSTLVSRIKAGGLGGGGQPCSTFDAVAAVLWRCRTRAALSDAGDGKSPAPLTFPCNVRAHVGAPAGYYGNCVAMQVVPATVGVVADSDVGGLVRMIRSAKAKVAGLLSREGGGVEREEAVAAPPLWYETLAVSSWRNMGLEAMDFGGGAPAQVLWRTEQPTVPSCVLCPPRRAGSDGGVDVSTMFLKPEHVDAFLGELARLVVAASEE